MRKEHDLYAFCETSLSSGVKVFFKHLPYATKVNIGAQLSVGAKDGEPGVIHCLEHVNVLGNAKLSIEDDIEDVGGRISLGATNWDATRFYGSVPIGAETHLVNGLERLLAGLDFTDQELEIEKRSIENEIVRKHSFPEFLERALEAELRGEKYYKFFKNGRNPFRVLGTLAQVKAITAEKLRLHHDRYYHTANLTLFATGNLNEDILLQSLERASFTQFTKEGLRGKTLSFPSDLDFVPFVNKEVTLPISKFGNGGQPPASSTVSWEVYISRKYEIETYIFQRMFGNALFSTIRKARGETYTPSVENYPYAGGINCYGQVGTTGDPHLITRLIKEALDSLLNSNARASFEKTRLRMLKGKGCLNEDSTKIIRESMQDYATMGKIESITKAIARHKSASFEKFQQLVSGIRESMQIVIYDRHS